MWVCGCAGVGQAGVKGKATCECGVGRRGRGVDKGRESRGSGEWGKDQEQGRMNHRGRERTKGEMKHKEGEEHLNPIRPVPESVAPLL